MVISHSLTNVIIGDKEIEKPGRRHLTIYFYENNILSMEVLINHASDSENAAFIYSGLGSVSNESREYLKNIAQSLIAIQNNPGSPMPENIGRELIQYLREDK